MPYDRSVEILNTEFLAIRSRLLDLSASLDRIDRAGRVADDDPRMALIHRALEVVAGHGNDRAAQVQLLFSRAYEPQWRRAWNLTHK
jgi:hypothetical protein